MKYILEQLLILIVMLPFIYLAIRNMYLSDKMRAKAFKKFIEESPYMKDVCGEDKYDYKWKEDKE